MTATETVLAYHARSKHHLSRYAVGPETLDWTAQPNPFREFAGSPRIRLPWNPGRICTPLTRIYDPSGGTPTPLSRDSIGDLCALSMGISAWKEWGPDRWALRANPSSGNLHPTEAYLIVCGVAGIEDGVYHYLSRDHSLEQRCQFNRGCREPGLWVGLSSIDWREAWKYGERAFRYCQLDVGHALGALRYAAGALGWRVRLSELSAGELADLLGLGRDNDFTGAEREEPELLVEIASASWPGQARPQGTAARWQGQANVLDPRPMYRWPVINEVTAASVRNETASAFEAVEEYPTLGGSSSMTPAATMILRRRSAQRFDRRFTMRASAFYRLLDCLLARQIPPWDVWRYAPRIHPVFLVHRVDGIEPGGYILVRRSGAEKSLRHALRPDFQWERPRELPAHIPLYRLAAADCREAARTVSCHQAIAGDACFSLGMLAEFEELVKADPWRYRQLHWEAGLVGHVLYLEAEAVGLRGTGIGCFFDDAFHELLGFESRTFATLYHFTVGCPLEDTRITTFPPYPYPEQTE